MPEAGDVKDPQPSSGSWWRSLPGILTGITATITAAAGLFAALQQAGAFGARSAQETKRADHTQTNTSATDARSAAPRRNDVEKHVEPPPNLEERTHAASNKMSDKVLGNWTWTGQPCALGPRVTRDAGQLVFTDPSTRFVHRVVSDEGLKLRTRVLTPENHKGELYSFQIDGETLVVIEERSNARNTWKRCNPE